jgi:alpha-L-fucosidase
MVAKHHDGFCLWPSKYTEYSVKNSPWDISSPLYGTDEYNTYFMNQLTELLTSYGPVDEVWFDGACREGANGRRQVYDWVGYYKIIRSLQPQAVIAVTGPDVRWVGTESGYGRETEWSVVPTVPSGAIRCCSSTCPSTGP